MVLKMKGRSQATSYRQLYETLSGVIPASRLICDPLRTLAYGTDASFYRLIPKIVVVVMSEADVVELVKCCATHGTPVTFRAAGTSLSGQAVTDSVLAVLGDGWNKIKICDDATSVILGPGAIGGEVNRRLAPFNRKIGPDPASINAAKIGGIAANNASGMCCGIAQNSYQTVAGMRVVLSDGTLLDTRDDLSRTAFANSKSELLEGLARLAKEVAGDMGLSERIRKKYSIKNTTGYSLNALVDFSHPFDILEHLMIGSEGTLGFISEITYRTVPDSPYKATAFVVFDSVTAACEAVSVLKTRPVSAVELIDRNGLLSVAHKPEMPDYIRSLDIGATALLIETRGEDATSLSRQISDISEVLKYRSTLNPLRFSTDPFEIERLWNIRKGLFPSVGAMRKKGTSVIIEDIAVPVRRLADATSDLRTICNKHGYEDTIIFGHALEGNLHFVFAQDFATPSEVDRYSRFMDAVCEMVVNDYDGSLKAEHGTGRNMAPFVEMEWGSQAYDLMWRIKNLFDPNGLLNPGVILNGDATVHVKNLKALPIVFDAVDQCIECGFCEPICPSAGMTLTPRQRITSWRDISRRERVGENMKGHRDSFVYLGLDTCAACGLCATVCPIGIDTGNLIKELRGRRLNVTGRTLGSAASRYFSQTVFLVKLGLQAATVAQRLIGSNAVDKIGRGLRKISGNRLPLWLRTTPTATTFVPNNSPGRNSKPKVVYMPSCVTRAMGPALDDPESEDMSTVAQRLFEKAGFDVVFPNNLSDLCCGQPFDSKGLSAQGKSKAQALEMSLSEASEGGVLPIVMSASPCVYKMKSYLGKRLKIMDITEFLFDLILPELTIARREKIVVLHIPCSIRKMGLDSKLRRLVETCAEKVIVPDNLTCCGFAGNLGFSVPELNEHALRFLREQIPAECSIGVSTSRTCEIGTSLHSGIPFHSIVYLLDQCAVPATL